MNGPKNYLGPEEKIRRRRFRAGRSSFSFACLQWPGMVVFAQAKSRETNGVRNAGPATRELKAALIEGAALMI